MKVCEFGTGPRSLEVALQHERSGRDDVKQDGETRLTWAPLLTVIGTLSLVGSPPQSAKPNLPDSTTVPESSAVYDMPLSAKILTPYWALMPVAAASTASIRDLLNSIL